MIGIYSPFVPPTPGGVADHTLVLARAIERLGVPTLVLADRGEPALFSPVRCVVGVKPERVAAAAREHAVSALFIQYVPFLFARRGVSPRLVLGTHRLSRSGLKLAVMVHEPFVPFSRLPWLVTGVPQRAQLAYLLLQASHIYAPVQRFADIARAYGGRRASIHIAPIGATLPPSHLSRSAARARLGLTDGDVAVGVFSPNASGFLHDWIATAATRLSSHPNVRWVLFGYGSDRHRPGYPTGVRVTQVSDSSPDSVTATMRALDVALSPYSDGLTMRRSGAMLALAHDVPLVSSTGFLHDPRLAQLAACEDGADAFADRVQELVQDPEARHRWGQRAKGYAEIASIDALAKLLVRDLG